LRKDVNVYLFDPTRKYFHIVIELENVPGALHNVLDVTRGLELNILGSFSSVDSAAKVGVWSGFVEDNNHDAVELRRKLGGSPYVHDAIVVESNKGFLVDGVHFPLAFNTGTRAVLMTARYVARMLETIRKQFGSGGNVIIYEEGRAYGKDVGAEYFQRLGADFVTSNLGEVLKLYQALGWFRLEAVEVEHKTGKIVVRTAENFECAGSQSRVPLSHFVRGHIAGTISTYMEKEMACEETNCVAMGEKYCVFALTPK
jgi:predicted hydrocarbon binding protein